MLEIKPPNNSISTFNSKTKNIHIFLAGSIDEGKAVNWQNELVKTLNFLTDDIIVFNPRRDNFLNVEQTISNKIFKEQVEWELKYLLFSDIIVMYFDKNGKAPISLLELGILAGRRNSVTQQIIVYCPEGFWKKGNVDFICKEFRITQVNNSKELKTSLLESIFDIKRIRKTTCI